MLNDDMIKGKWDQLKGSIQKTWAKLTDDDVESARGDFNKLSGIVQSKYGEAEDSIRTKLNAFTADIGRDEKTEYRPGEPII